jgi:membrane associated rhomboid family serine protease
MFIPIRTDYRLTRRPWVNYALIALNFIIHLYVFRQDDPNAAVRPYLLYPDEPVLWQFFTSMFLHADWMHILGNMLFLWVFGNALNDCMGHVAYLAFYLAGGVIAGVGYVLLAGRAPVLGASGAICAVTGAYLVLFPRVRVTVLMIFYFITTMQVPSLIFVGFQFVYNIFMTMAGAGAGVAYTAHSSGYLYGIGLAMGLLAAKLLPRGDMDLLSLIRQSRRRGRYRRMVSQGFDPFRGVGSGKPRAEPPPQQGAPEPSRRRWVDARSVESSPSDTQEAREMALRREIAAACSRHDVSTAAAKYLQLVQIADDAVLSRQNQLDVANQLMADEQYPAAADAYERFLRQYRSYRHVPDIHLMLGLLYGRYLHQYERAEQYLRRAIDALRDDRKVQMARDELLAVQQRRGL